MLTTRRFVEFQFHLCLTVCLLIRDGTLTSPETRTTHTQQPPGRARWSSYRVPPHGLLRGHAAAVPAWCRGFCDRAPAPILRAPVFQLVPDSTRIVVVRCACRSLPMFDLVLTQRLLCGRCDGRHDNIRDGLPRLLSLRAATGFTYARFNHVDKRQCASRAQEAADGGSRGDRATEQTITVNGWSGQCCCRLYRRLHRKIADRVADRRPVPGGCSRKH
jgi:hypothetical protein